GQAKRHPGYYGFIFGAPLKGKSFNYQCFCPFRARLLVSIRKPRVSLRLPWAMRLLGFQPVFEYYGNP
ncbi:hypothetical protein, partial [Hallella sp.]|uniref:hypothetical protein n=1 Tax=Hallella sp. TaxID=2980186 RepID=UPI002A90C421